jgi:hypothetical protein
MTDDDRISFDLEGEDVGDDADAEPARDSGS